MRVAFILNSAGMYGANRSLLGLIRYLISKDVQCFAILPKEGEVIKELDEYGVEWEIVDYRPCVWYPGYVGLPFVVNLVRLPGMVRILRDWNVDLIHTNSSTHDMGILAARILHIKHIWHVREILEEHYHTRNIFPGVYRRLRASSDAVICVSDYVYAYNMEKYPNDNMRMVYNPYDIEYYDICRTEFAPEQEVNILVAGNLTASKGQLDIVKAMAVLRERGVDFVRVLLVGGGDEQYVEEIRNCILQNQLEEWVRYAEYMPDLRQVRKKSDIALNCSVAEALPRVTVEGMLGELLSIGADSGGTAELIQDGVRGLLYEPGNYTQLADKIEYAVGHKKECRQMIKKAKAYAVENFELEKSGEKVLEIYREVLKK